MKNKLLLTIASICFSTNLFAQTTKEQARKQMIDSIKMAALSDYATRYPILRQGSFATDIIGARMVKGELNGHDLYQGKMNTTRVRSNFRVPLAQWGKNNLTGTVSYQQVHFDTRDITSYSPGFPATNRSLTKGTVGFTATFSRTDTLFHHQINYSGGISGLTDDATSIKRINYIGTVNVPLSRTETSSWSVGLAVILDPSSVAPVVPFVSYWHKFKDSDLDLFVDMPYRIALRKQVSKRSWAILGSELGGNLYFFDLNQPGLPQNAIYSSIEIRSGATFEYRVTKKLVLGIAGGLYTTAESRMFDHNNKPSDYFFRTSNGTVPYISFSVSLLPFLKSN
ncbi:hypothetical protein [Mucilaginibacter sp. SP1R1]|uniref:hypothetical protein n=1 Tax=Mucilaginibacter sp. SP1R1 TaxID=2723091 RepID=UPI0016221C65|nr:hypothetical protein [Mucilaginibacter sp. SP1R1]MBB6149960.1 hypothetical protein [Mucilaginibacter sp. SP1R1]